jgi:hypothetical protein
MMFANVMLLTKWGVARRSETSLWKMLAAERFFVPSAASGGTATLLRMTLFKQPPRSVLLQRMEEIERWKKQL